MAWRDDLLPASWRGVPFLLRSSRAQLGRRAEVHEFPAGEEHYAEDLGRAARRYEIEGFVVGEDYVSRRQELERAFETPGSGRLSHPLYGVIEAQVVGAVTISESDADGGGASFSASFVEAGESDPLKVFVSARTTTEVATELEVLEVAADEDFAAVWSAIAEVASVYDEALEFVQAFASDLRAIVGAAAGVMGTIEAGVRAVEDLAEQAQALIALPARLAASVRSAIASIFSALSSVAEVLVDAVTAERNASSVVAPATSRARGEILLETDTRIAALQDLPQVEGASSARVQRRANAAALSRMILVSRICGLIRAADVVALENIETSQAMRARVLSLLRDLQASWEDAAATVSDLRRLWIEDMRTAVAALPFARSVEVGEDAPLLAIAYDEVGDISAYDRFLARTEIEHPGFVSRGASLIYAEVDDG
jgi:prophage DNA circulation protein